MSDNNLSDTPTDAAPEVAPPGYEGHSETEVETFADAQFGTAKGLARPIGGYQYVAPPAPGYDVHGIWHSFPCHTRSGYAAHAIALHMMLLEGLKIPTSLIPHRTSAIDIDKFPKDRFEMLLKWNKDTCGHPEMMIVSLPPDLKMYGLSRALVNYVAFEATRVSDYARIICNDEQLSALWCVSDFTRRAFVDSGVYAEKVFTVRPAICDGVWKHDFRPPFDVSAMTRPFRFGSMGTWHERKGFHDLVRAYFMSFKRTDNVELAIRTSHFGDELTIKRFREKVIAEIAEIAKEFGDNNFPASQRMPVIRLLSGTALSDTEVIEWLGNEIDCYVNPSYGEGLGIPAMWAAAQGLRLVSSDFGAVGEFLLSSPEVPSHLFRAHLAPVPPSMIKHNSVYALEGSEWGAYDVKDLAAAMLGAYAAGPARSNTGAVYARRYFSFNECLPGLHKALAAVARPEIMAEKWNIKES